LAEHRGTVHSIAFSPAGDLLASGGDDGTIRLWKPAEGELRQLDVGTPVQQVGFRGGRLWARLSGGELRFYGGGHQQTATMLIEPNSALVFTAKGWYSGSGRLLETIRMFDAERPLNPVETRERESADKVMAEIRG
jgi:WD40 repeat protein